MFNLLNRTSESHNLLLWSFIILIMASCFSNYTNYSNFVIYPIWVLWLVSNVSIDYLPKNEKTFVRVSYTFLFLMLLYQFIGYSTTETGQLLRNINWIMAGVVAVYVLKHFSGRDLAIIYIIMTISLLTLLLILIRTGRSLIAIESLEKASTVASAWYGSLYMLLSGVSLIVFLHVRKFLPRVIALIVLVLSIYLNFYIMQRSTNVIFTIAEIILILVFTIKNKPLIIAMTILVAGFAIFASYSNYLILFLDWLSSVSPSERLSTRFNEISIALTYEDVTATRGGSMSARSDLMNISWNTFTSSYSHILFGAGDHHDFSVIGDHGFFVDTLARYGIIGGGLMFAYFKKQYQIVMSFLNKKKDWALYMQFAIVFVFYVLRNYYGSLSYGLANLLILFYFPLTCQIVKNYKNNSKFSITKVSQVMTHLHILKFNREKML